MRGLSKVWLCLITAGFASAANADIIIDQQTLPNADILSYDISVVDGAYTINITTRDGWTLARNDGGPVDPPPPPPPVEGVATTLTSNVSTAELGDVVTFTWTANQATFCDTKWGNAEWKAFVPSPAGGSVNIVMDSVGETQFRMYCESADGAEAVGVFVTVTEPSQTVANCPNPEVTSGRVVTWRDYLGGFYPDVGQLEQRKFLPRFEYVAVKFNTGTDDIRGIFQTIQVSDPNRFVSVSQCPGRFTDAAPGCFQRQANGQEIQWSNNGSFGNCDLQKGEDYYLNLTYYDVEDRSGSLCSSSSCAFNLKVATAQ